MVKDVSICLSVTPNDVGIEIDRFSWARLLRDDLIRFPMLEFLTLDFTDWELGDSQGLIVSAVFRLILLYSMPGGFFFNFLVGSSID